MCSDDIVTSTDDSNGGMENPNTVKEQPLTYLNRNPEISLTAARLPFEVSVQVVLVNCSSFEFRSFAVFFNHFKKIKSFIVIISLLYRLLCILEVQGVYSLSRIYLFFFF